MEGLGCVLTPQETVEGLREFVPDRASRSLPTQTDILTPTVFWSYDQPMRSSVSAALGLLLLLGACTTDQASPRPSPAFGQRTETYHDPAGWSVDVPDSWAVLPFESTKGAATSMGVQLSNAPLPPPKLHPGLPIQTSGIDLPPRGVSVVIATDVDPRYAQEASASPPSPPLSLSESGFAEGSCVANESPCLSTLWFTVGGQELLLSIKVGPLASGADKAILGPLVSSIRAD